MERGGPLIDGVTGRVMRRERRRSCRAMRTTVKSFSFSSEWNGKPLADFEWPDLGLKRGTLEVRPLIVCRAARWEQEKRVRKQPQWLCHLSRNEGTQMTEEVVGGGKCFNHGYFWKQKWQDTMTAWTWGVTEGKKSKVTEVFDMSNWRTDLHILRWDRLGHRLVEDEGKFRVWFWPCSFAMLPRYSRSGEYTVLNCRSKDWALRNPVFKDHKAEKEKLVRHTGTKKRDPWRPCEKRVWRRRKW